MMTSFLKLVSLLQIVQLHALVMNPNKNSNKEESSFISLNSSLSIHQAMSTAASVDISTPISSSAFHQFHLRQFSNVERVIPNVERVVENDTVEMNVWDEMLDPAVDDVDVVHPDPVLAVDDVDVVHPDPVVAFEVSHA